MLLYKFRSLDRLDWVADILVFQQLYCARYFDMNDPFEGVCTVHGYFGTAEKSGRRYYSATDVEDLQNPEEQLETRLCSLSRSYHDLRLWSHHGGGHKGIAIEIDFQGLGNRPHKVIYLRGLKKYDEALGERPSVQDILSHKTDHWAYEDEYRVIQTEPYFSIAGRIRRVLLGPRCHQKEAAVIKRLVPEGTVVVRTRLNHLETKVELSNP